LGRIIDFSEVDHLFHLNTSLMAQSKEGVKDWLRIAATLKNGIFISYCEQRVDQPGTQFDCTKELIRI